MKAKTIGSFIIIIIALNIFAIGLAIFSLNTYLTPESFVGVIIILAGVGMVGMGVQNLE